MLGKTLGLLSSDDKQSPVENHREQRGKGRVRDVPIYLDVIDTYVMYLIN